MQKILCVEDERFLREDIAEELSEAGFQVIEAADGAEALGKIVDDKPDLVLSDISMPNMSGTEMMVRLRADYPQFAEMPVIFLSALADRNDVLDGVKLGADDYLTKPIDYEMLVTKVEAALRCSKRMQQMKQKEHIKLYKTLTRQSGADDLEFRWPTMETRKIVLVGRSDKGLWHVQRLFEELGHDVNVFTSGRSYLNKIEDGKLKPDLTFVWFQTDDIQAIMIPPMAADKSIKHILVVPEELYRPGMNIDRDGFIDAFGLPIEDQQLVEKMKSLGKLAAAA